MNREVLTPERGSPLRKNGLNELKIEVKNDDDNFNYYLINGNSFITDDEAFSEIIIQPNECYMIINKGKKSIQILYGADIAEHEILYDPYKFEQSEKIIFEEDVIKTEFLVPEGYIDTLPKWYSFKFTYPKHNLIFIRPGLGLSIQTHEARSEYWEILSGKPIIINGNMVHYHVENGTKFKIPMDTYHTIINPNLDKFIVIKESWDGVFDEEDIMRIFNPNNYKTK